MNDVMQEKEESVIYYECGRDFCDTCGDCLECYDCGSGCITLRDDHQEDGLRDV